MSRIIRPTTLVRGLAPLALLVALAACKEETVQAPEPVRPVKAMLVEAGVSERQLAYSGAVEARVSATLGFRVAGKIVARSVDVGDRVEAGTVVARLDTTDLGLALKSADAAVESARARLQVATDQVGRTRTLFDKGHVAKAALDSAALEVDQAAAALETARSNRDQAANQSGYAELRADGPGIVTEVRAEAGQVVAAGAPVVVVARDGEKEIRIAVPEQDIRHFGRDLAVSVGYWAAPDLVQTGRVREIAGSADAASRTFAVRVGVADDARVRLGQTATVQVAVPVGAAAIVVPVTALAERDRDTIVWVVDRASETVAARRIEVATVAPEGVRIAAGLAPGDLVVTAGTQFMIDGKKIRIAGSPIATASLQGPTRR